MSTTLATAPDQSSTENASTKNAVPFNEAFRRLLVASNFVQHLRNNNADAVERIDAQDQLLQARIEAQRARAHLY
jgi:hypothetical protein